jgi:hypothetical protein
VTRTLLVLGCACSSSKPRTADDATRAPHAPVALDAPAIAIDATPPPPPPANPDAKTGDLQIRVEWKDVPIPMRASPGKTACHTPRAPVVAPTTTWGVPDVLLVVEGATLPAPPAAPRIVVADCALAPRIVAATSAILESASDKPEKLAFARRGELASLAKLAPGKPSAVRLPIAGHEVALPLDANGVYELTLDGETSWVIASASAGVTEPNGALLVRDLAPGAYPVTAWLPPRAGGQAKLAKGTVTVVAGDLAELTLTFE